MINIFKLQKRSVTMQAWLLGVDLSLSEAVELLEQMDQKAWLKNDAIYTQAPSGIGSIKTKALNYMVLDWDGFWFVDAKVFKENYAPVKTSYSNDYIKKSIEVDVCYYDDLKNLTLTDYQQILRFIDPKLKADSIDLKQVQKQGYLKVQTLEGPVEFKPEFFLIKGPLGDLYPISRQSLVKSYVVS